MHILGRSRCTVAALMRLEKHPQESVSPQVYPGDPENTPWCRGQIVFYGGSTAAERDPRHIGYPEGYLGDMWLYNVSSNTIRYAAIAV